MWGCRDATAVCWDWDGRRKGSVQLPPNIGSGGVPGGADGFMERLRRPCGDFPVVGHHLRATTWAARGAEETEGARGKAWVKSMKFWVKSQPC